MTKQQYFIAALCILFMAGLQFAGFKMKEKTGKNNPLWYDDDEEDEKGKGRAKAKTAEKVPDEVEDSELDFEQQKRLAAAWTETKIREEVRIAILEKPQWGGRRNQILKSLGWRINAPVLEIINDPSLKTKLLTETEEGFRSPIPLRVACNLMRDHAPELLAEPLFPLMKHNSPKVRGVAAQMIATSGSPKYVSALKSALSDTDKDVVRLTLMGLSDAKALASESETLFSDVQRHVELGEEYQAAEALLALNEKRAIEFFESDTFFRIESAGLPGAMSAMIDRKKSLARPKLLKLIEVARAAQSKTVDENARGHAVIRDALHLLGRQQNSEDAALFEDLIVNAKHPGQVATGYLAFHGLDEIEDQFDKARENNEWVGLNRQKKLYMALQELDWDMDEGGLQEYLGGEYGDHWQEALAGLKAVGLYERETRLKAELDKLSKAGASNVPAQRRKQLEVLMKKDPNAFDTFDEFYNADPQSLYAGMVKFAVRNKAAFK